MATSRATNYLCIVPVGIRIFTLMNRVNDQNSRTHDRRDNRHEPRGERKSERSSGRARLPRDLYRQSVTLRPSYDACVRISLLSGKTRTDGRTRKVSLIYSVWILPLFMMYAPDAYAGLPRVDTVHSVAGLITTSNCPLLQVNVCNTVGHGVCIGNY